MTTYGLDICTEKLQWYYKQYELESVSLLWLLRSDRHMPTSRPASPHLALSRPHLPCLASAHVMLPTSVESCSFLVTHFGSAAFHHIPYDLPIASYMTHAHHYIRASFLSCIYSDSIYLVILQHCTSHSSSLESALFILVVRESSVPCVAATSILWQISMCCGGSSVVLGIASSVGCLTRRVAPP